MFNELINEAPIITLFPLQLDLYEIDEGKPLKVNVSEPKTRLFIGNIPKSKGKDEIEEELRKVTGNPIILDQKWCQNKVLTAAS